MTIEGNFTGKFFLTNGTIVGLFGMFAKGMFHLQKDIAEHGVAKPALPLRFCNKTVIKVRY